MPWFGQVKIAQEADSRAQDSYERNDLDYYNQQAARFVDGWSRGHAFPLAFPLEDVESLVESLINCPSSSSRHFGALALEWIRSLLEAARHAETTPLDALASFDKAHAITRIEL